MNSIGKLALAQDCAPTLQNATVPHSQLQRYSGQAQLLLRVCNKWLGTGSVKQCAQLLGAVKHHARKRVVALFRADVCPGS
jgi:hypothetical protein